VPRLCALVVYYPTKLPDVDPGVPLEAELVVKSFIHLVVDQELVPGCPSYTYKDVRVGFAEVGNGAYDRISANLAFTRTLGVVRGGFRIQVDLERIWERHLEREFFCTFG